jgi:undecaprenyl-diphosphatase
MTADDFQPLIDWLQLNPNWLLFSIFFISFIESLALAGIIIPGVLLLFLVATVAGHLDFAISTVLIAGFAGAILGDGISFYLGRYFKDSIPNYWPFSRYPDALESGRHFFYRHGGKSVMLGRFIGPIRPVLPLIAGMLGMSQVRFAAFNATSALLWAPFYLMPGYLAGKASSWQLPENTASILSTLLILLLVFAVGFRYLSLKLQHNGSLYEALLPESAKSWLTYTLNGSASGPSQPNPVFEFPLASLTLLFGSTVFFIFWSILNTQTDALNALDTIFLHWTYALRSNLGTASEVISLTALSLTLLGDELFLYLSFMIFISLMLARKHYYAALHIIAAGIVTAVTTHALKSYFGIERPDIIQQTPASLAYPSGHSSGATVFYALIATFIAQEMPPHKRWHCYLTAALPVFLIAFSRVILGAHWLSDVVGGICLGLMICGLTRVSYGFYYARDMKQALTGKRDRLCIQVMILLWLCCAVLYQLWAMEQTLMDIQLKALG